MNDIVVTGMGIVCPLGLGTEPVFRRLTASRSGIGRLPEEIVPDVPCKVGGQVPSIADDPECGFDPDRTIPPKEQRKMGASFSSH